MSIRNAVLVFAAVVLMASEIAFGQQQNCPAVPFVTGLQAPVKIAFSQQHNLLIAEAGFGPNTGRISIVTVASGERRTLVDGLPSGFAPPDGAPSGPSGLAMRGRTLYVSIGAGDTTIAGPVPGSELPNPNPASPLFSSVLAFHFSAEAEERTSGFSLTAADQNSLASGARVTLFDTRGNRLDVELVTNLDSYVPNPRPGFPDFVRASNPFGLVLSANQLYVADASMNSIRRVDIHNGATADALSFPSFANPGPFGPPFIEPVPDNVRWYGDRLLVPLLTGAPFLHGFASIQAVDPRTGLTSSFIPGLTMAIDALPLSDGRLLTLEFSVAGGIPPLPPGRLNLYDSPQSTPATLAQCLVSPTSMVYDQATGKVYITEIFAGRVVATSVPVD